MQHISPLKGTHFKQKITVKCCVLRTFNQNPCIRLFTTAVNKASESLYISTFIASDCLTLYCFQHHILIKRNLGILARIISWENLKRWQGNFQQQKSQLGLSQQANFTAVILKILFQSISHTHKVNRHNMQRHTRVLWRSRCIYMCVYIQITKQLFNITEVVGVFVFLKTEFW